MVNKEENAVKRELRDFDKSLMFKQETLEKLQELNKEMEEIVAIIKK